MRRLFKAVAGALIMGAGSGAVAPAQAAPLDFSFTTVSGETGTFTLETDTPASGQPSVGSGIPGFPGIIYPNAVSNFFFSSPSSPEFNASGEIADWEVIPSVIPGNIGELSGVVYPSGCATGTTFTCLINVGVLYTGDVPELSDDPNSYSTGLGIDLFDPVTRQSLGIRPFSEYRVVPRQSVPEPDSGLSVLAVAIASASLLLKRKMNKTVQPS